MFTGFIEASHRVLKLVLASACVGQASAGFTALLWKLAKRTGFSVMWLTLRIPSLLVLAILFAGCNQPNVSPNELVF